MALILVNFANAQTYGGEIQARTNANAIGKVGRLDVNLKVYDSATLAKLNASIAVTKSGTWDITNAGTFATQATLQTGANVIGAVTQSGTWNITNLSGTVSLPTGASTLAEQQTQTTALQLIDDAVVAQSAALGTTKNTLIGGSVTTGAPTYTTGNINPLSLTTAGALRVDNSANTQPVSGTVTANAGTNLNTSALNLEATQSAMSAKLPATLGQKTMAASMAVVLASDQASIPVTLASTTITGTVAVTKSGTWDITNAGTFVTQPASATVPVSTMNSASANSGLNSALAGVFDDATPTAITENSFGFLRMSTNRNLFQTIRDAAGNERGANVNAANQLSVSVDASTTLTVNTHAVTNAAGSFVVQENGAALTALQLLDNAISGTGFNISQINGVAPLMGNGATGTGSPRVTIVSDGTAISTVGYMSVKLDQTTVGTTNAVSLAQIGATTVVTAGIAGTLAIGGNVATNVAIGTNPVNQGAQGVSAENAVVTTTRMVQLVADLVGKQIVMPYANNENFVSGTTAAMTATTTTSLIAAPAAGLRNYITTIVVSNAHATVGTDIVIQDGSGGATLMTIPAAAVYGGAVITLPVPLRQPTTATAIFCANVTTGASTKVSAVGYKGY